MAGKGYGETIAHWRRTVRRYARQLTPNATVFPDGLGSALELSLSGDRIRRIALLSKTGLFWTAVRLILGGVRGHLRRLP